MNRVSLSAIICLVTSNILFCLASERVINPNITLKFERISLTSALESISEQATVSFIYNSSKTDSIFVSCSAESQPLNDVLDHIFSQTELTYQRISHNRILILQQRKSFKLVLSGQIVDSGNKAPIPHANIELLHSDLGAVSDQNGRFELKYVTELPCTIRVQHVGFESKQVVINREMLTSELKIDLGSVVLEIDEITTYGNLKRDNETVVETFGLSIAPDDQRGLPIIGDQDVFRLLQLQSGVQNAGVTGSGVMIRGSMPAQSMVLLDGMTLYHSDHAFGLFSAFDSGIIEHLDLYKGGFPVNFSGRVGGLIDMVSKSGDPNEFHFALRSSQMLGGLRLEVPVLKRGSILFSARKSYRQNFVTQLFADVNRSANNLPPPEESEYDHSNYQTSFTDMFGKFTYLLSSRDALSFGAFWALDKGQHSDDFLVRAGVSPGDSSSIGRLVATNPEEKSKWGSVGFNAKWLHQHNPNFDISIATAYSNYFVDSESSESFQSSRGELNSSSVLVQNDIEDLAIRIEGNLKKTDQHAIQFGGELSSIHTSYVDSSIVKQNTDAQITSVFLQDSWKPNHSLQAVVGLRTSYNDRTKNWYLSPRIGAKLKLNHALSLNASWGKYHQFVMKTGDGFQYLTGRASWVLVDNQRLQPIDATHRNLGLEIALSDYRLEIEFYQKPSTGSFFEIRDLGDVAREDETLYNISAVHSQGIDLLLQKKSGSFSGWVSYGFNDSEISFPKTDGELKFPRDHGIPHTLNIVTKYEKSKWTLGATWLLASGRRYTIPVLENTSRPGSEPQYQLNYARAATSSQLPPERRLDLSLSRRFKIQKFDISAGISLYNVFDRDNVLHRYHTIVDNQVYPIDIISPGFIPTVAIEIQY